DFARLVLEWQRVEEGIADLDAGIAWTSDEIREKLGNPEMRVVWSNRALRSLADIHTRISADSEDAANRTADRILKRAPSWRRSLNSAGWLTGISGPASGS